MLMFFKTIERGSACFGIAKRKENTKRWNQHKCKKL